MSVPLRMLPPPLDRLYSRPNELLSGGPEAFERTLRSLRGHPVVVNKWASWCGPCRSEFPFFQKQVARRGKQVAFLAVDSEDARDEAREFLEEFPVPYPSFFDPKSDIAERLGSERNFPTTTFYDAGGELVYTKPGGYASEAALEDDIREYASPVPARDNEHVMRSSSRLPGARRPGRGADRERSAGRRAAGAVGRARHDDQPRLRRLGRPGARGRGGRRGRPGGLPPRHTGRVGRLDPRHREGHPCGADAGGRLRVAQRRPGRLRGRVHHRGRGRRRDGAPDEHRLGDPDLARRRRPGRGAGPEDPQRRGRLHPRAGGGTRPQRRPRGADGARRA